jgi:hypothetical protein
VPLADLPDARHIVPGDVLEAVKALPSEGTWRRVATLAGSADAALRLEFSVSGLGEGETTRTVLVIRDITPAASPAPICAHCKSVDDGHGTWQPIEAYLGEHTGTTLRQEMCPACMRILYPELCCEEHQKPGTAEAA